jgi:hypothetical protein
MLDRTSASLLVCARVVIVCTIVQVPGGDGRCLRRRVRGRVRGRRAWSPRLGCCMGLRWTVGVLDSEHEGARVVHGSLLGQGLPLVWLEVVRKRGDNTSACKVGISPFLFLQMDTSKKNTVVVL